MDAEKMRRLMKSILILVFSVIVSLILYYLSIGNPDFISPNLTNAIIVLLAILNIVANFFQIAEFLGEKLRKREDKLNIDKGKKLVTPIISDIQRIIKHLEKIENKPKKIDTSLWTKKSESYHFLTSDKELQDKIKGFYKEVEEFNSLLEILYEKITNRIRINTYTFSEKAGLVCAVDWNSTKLTGYNSEYDIYCNKEAQRLSGEVCRVILNNDEISSPQYRILSNPFFNLLKEDDFLKFSITHKTENDEELRKLALELADDFAKSCFSSLISEDELSLIKAKKKLLIDISANLLVFLEKEVKKTMK